MDYAYDFSVVPGPAPRALVDAGATGILVYSFASRQSDAYLDECRALGLTVVWIWERNTDSIFSADGEAECRAHELRAKPGELTYVACDTNDGGVAGRDLTPFLRDWAATTREDVFGLYGSSGAIRQGQAFGGKCARWWGVVNWINGGGPDNDPRNIAYWESVGAHLVQLIGSPIDNTDQNAILDPAWGSIGTTTEDDDVKPLYIAKTSDPAQGIWVTDGMNKRHVLPDEWAFVQFVNGNATKVIGLSDQWWDSIPSAASAAVGAGGPLAVSGTFTGKAT